MEFDTSKLRICRECEKVLRDRPFSRPFFMVKGENTCHFSDGMNRHTVSIL